ncbi:hypothetical protein [Microbacter margulisiae]|uniref:Uncharacterized protein n=1 Tax=Microbacter margulisiae TaxID=1350067 RepID=A0A7W5H338_9PORP|nr:hypothetical protein [Microbacter margulisiae]MBB3188091.1 hypothetical protein [Microbacter margulisiae]
MKAFWILSVIFLLQSMNLMAVNSSDMPVNVSVDASSGEYTVFAPMRNWTFQGTIGQPMSDVTFLQGQDSIGHYKMVSFKWKNQVNYIGTIRWYPSLPIVMFTLTLPHGAKRPIVSFPDFTSLPDSLYSFSYKNDVFAAPIFSLEQTSTPWLFFDAQDNAYVISPASDFIVAKLTGDGRTNITSGLNPEITQFPSGFSHSTILVIDRGIRHTWNVWGKALRTIYHKKRPANDQGALLNRFGYWTDNGADYYYQYDPQKGYAGTLLALQQRYKQEGIPLGYMQLDSWWYEKSIYDPDGRPDADHKNPSLPSGAWNRYGGLMEYTADPFLFPHGLSAFQKALGLPLVTHNRWIDPRSPYHLHYTISGYAAIDPQYWKDRMGYLKQAGVICYEQDWLNYIYDKSPEMISTLSVGNRFTDNMAHAAQNDGITLQYCMAMPRFFLQGVQYNNLTTIRTSNDRFEPKKWKWFIFTSQLAYEMGIWPWCDVFKSQETDNMIVSVLSAGPVGIGDAIGKEDKANIMLACRADGVLVKPDIPLLPLDSDYIQIARGEKAPLLAYTYTQHDKIRTGYVLAFADGIMTSRTIAFRPSELGFKGRIAVFDPSRHVVELLSSDDLFHSMLPPANYTYYIVAPVTQSGIAFFGDAGKIASTGKKRIASILSMHHQLQVKVIFAGERTIVLRGYSEHPFKVSRGILSLNASTHLFTLSLNAPSHGDSVIVNFLSNQ